MLIDVNPLMIWLGGDQGTDVPARLKNTPSEEQTRHGAVR
jgi:hypothetical protein